MTPRWALGLLILTGCTAVLGEDFSGYVARPTHCDPRAPATADPTKSRQCGPTETCLFATPAGGTSTTETSCFPSVAPRPAQAKCEYAAECGAGLTCTALGCVEWCSVGTACEGGRECVGFAPVLQLGADEIGFCTVAPCDPVGDSCSGATCAFYTPTRTGCIQGGTGARGTSCANDGDCRGGLACDDVTRRCTLYCRLGTADCGAGISCRTNPELPLQWNGTNYGYCPP